MPAAFRASLGQAEFVPLQTSVASHAPSAARHTTPAGRIASPGQYPWSPSQTSPTSQPPVDGRQIVPAGTTTSGGQRNEVPVHASAVSQPLAAARHTLPAVSGSQVPLVVAPVAVLHAWQSMAPLPQAVLQHTPSMQFDVSHSEFTEHATPLTFLGKSLVAASTKPASSFVGVSDVILICTGRLSITRLSLLVRLS